MTEDQIREKVIKALSKALAEEGKKIQKPAWKQLQTQAKSFYTNYNLLVQDRKNKKIFNGTLLKEVFIQKGSFDVKNIEQRLTDVKNKFVIADIDKAMYLLAFQFLNHLDVYRERTNKRIGAYVTSVFDKKSKTYILDTYEIPSMDLVSLSTTDGKLKISTSTLKTKKYKTLESKNINQEKNEDYQQHLLEARLAYTAVQNRLDVYYDLAGKTGNDKRNGYLLWKNQSSLWVGAQIQSSGSLAEGYVQFLLDKHNNNLCKTDPGDPLYFNHRFVEIFYEDYLKNATSLSAIKEEDVVLNDLNLEYAVKIFNAELPDLPQFARIAEYIMNSPEPPDDIEEEITARLKKAKDLNPFYKDLSKIEDIVAKEIIEESKKYFEITI